MAENVFILGAGASVAAGAPVMSQLCGRGRDWSYLQPPAQTPACGTTAPGSSLVSDGQTLPWVRPLPLRMSAVSGSVSYKRVRNCNACARLLRGERHSQGRCGSLLLHRTGFDLLDLSRNDLPQPVCRHCYPWPVGTLTVMSSLLNPLYIVAFIDASDSYLFIAI